MSKSTGKDFNLAYFYNIKTLFLIEYIVIIRVKKSYITNDYFCFIKNGMFSTWLLDLMQEKSC